jgi:isoleucyl-tRNA synthetase
VTVTASGAQADVLERHAADLPMLFITSSVTVARTAEGAMAIAVSRAPGDKCPRCWRTVVDLVEAGETAGLCERCSDVVGGVVASRG